MTLKELQIGKSAVIRKRELGAKWAAGVALWQCAVAWIAAWIVHLIGTLF